MSRTKHHGDKAKMSLFEGRTWGWKYWHGWREEPTRPKRKRSEGPGWAWLQATPSWWVREMMTKPQRARTRAAIHEVMRMEHVVDDPARWGYVDTPNFPLAKKPHHYYW